MCDAQKISCSDSFNGHSDYNVSVAEILNAPYPTGDKDRRKGMIRFTFLNIEWNNYNGFIFSFINFETISLRESTLLGLSFSKYYITFDILFFHFEREFYEKHNY